MRGHFSAAFIPLTFQHKMFHDLFIGITKEIGTSKMTIIDSHHHHHKLIHKEIIAGTHNIVTTSQRFNY
jgi:hypothetical protein